MADSTQTTTRSVIVPDSLGAIGLGLSADILEDVADTMKAFPLHAESAQLVADWLRQVAILIPEAA